MSEPIPTATQAPESTAAPRPGYEFGAEDNRVIGDLASYGRSVGLVAFLLGGMAFVAGLFTLEAICLLQALLCFCVGSWIRRAAESFQKIVDTQEHDIPHLMVALKQLKNVLALIYYLVIFAIVVSLILLTVILVMGLRGYFGQSVEG